MNRCAATVLLLSASACAATPGPPSSAAAEPASSRPMARPTPRPAASGRERPAKAPGDREVGKLVGITEAHNRVRAGVGVGPLVWSNELAAYAQAWADRLKAGGCNLEHRASSNYGENLFWSSGTATPASVVAEWTSERSGYDHAKNRCRGVCGHYTQVVWKRSARLGCGVATCGGAELWVCNYDPPGNFVGESPY